MNPFRRGEVHPRRRRRIIRVSPCIGIAQLRRRSARWTQRVISRVGTAHRHNCAADQTAFSPPGSRYRRAEPGTRRRRIILSMQLFVYSHANVFDLKYIIKPVAQVAEPLERGER
jgi:hypothetical protein